MFSTKFLNQLRSYEIDQYLPYLDKHKKILELGGGTGEQAKALSELGYNIISVDLENSTYSENRVFPVTDYDGINLPFEDESFDIIFSSNVLEHIPDLDTFQHELTRVLKKDGYCIHIMPSASWRLWTSVANYIELIQRLALTAYKAFPKSMTLATITSSVNWMARESAGLVKYYIIPPRHGEDGNVWSEIFLFSRFRWIKHFKRSKLKLCEITPLRLFYTGHMVFGHRLPMQARRLISRILGSACILYRVSTFKCGDKI